MNYKKLADMIYINNHIKNQLTANIYNHLKNHSKLNPLLKLCQINRLKVIVNQHVIKQNNMMKIKLFIWMLGKITNQ